ncbi:uncharacterized protein EI90DRAFT_3019429 [Cantharellus anzutake]|uniref:uncharacterized protein n=1 Tax=Cantharellus anzutake TaxID=1750568 RepID=UPI0019033C65|nr:uncharacterized protein EI90DRAFT_3019429 [Cantharellus anzutake]KAF8324666.1 hypothetical protein EI90DRAFT_3019429 [Cantharellus anzutake]
MPQSMEDIFENACPHVRKTNPVFWRRCLNHRALPSSGSAIWNMMALSNDLPSGRMVWSLCASDLRSSSQDDSITNLATNNCYTMRRQQGNSIAVAYSIRMVHIFHMVKGPNFIIGKGLPLSLTVAVVVRAERHMPYLYDRRQEVVDKGLWGSIGLMSVRGVEAGELIGGCGTHRGVVARVVGAVMRGGRLLVREGAVQ